MKTCMVEVCRENSAGSIGAWYVMQHAGRAGYHVDLRRTTSSDYDVELLSLHHCNDFDRLPGIPKRAKFRIVGGHPMANNPRPVIPFADAICIGEGESWIGPALQLIEEHNAVEPLIELPGTIVSKYWRMGMSPPKPNVERPLPDNAAYLNHKDTRRAAWYVEIARGCPYKCHFCELGHSMPFRFYDAEHIKRVLDGADTSITRKINFYAPDEASHPHYHELFDYLMGRGYAASFSSMRIDSILKRDLPALKTNHLLRVGIDGLSEETRRRVNKPITDSMIVEYFTRFVNRGHVRFKMFFIFGYPWETVADFDHFENLMRRVMSIPLKKNVALRIKWTPFVPQPCTPLGDCKARYDFEMVKKINVWHALNDKPRDEIGYREPSWWIENDGMPGFETHRRQCELTAGDEFVLLNRHHCEPLHKPR